MARRTREFDRSDFFGDLFLATAPHNQVCMKTTDGWRSNRKLMADAMSPQFLQSVAGSQIHATFSELIEVWTSKERLAQGHSFDASRDIEEAMLDAIYVAAFGSSVGTTKSQSDLISDLGKLDGLSDDTDSIATFPHAPYPAIYEAFTTIANSCEIPMHSPLGRRHHKFATKYYPSLRSAIALKDKLIHEKLQAAWEEVTHPNASEDEIKCAADLIVEREVKLANKEGRSPQFDSPTTRDELVGFIQAVSTATRDPSLRHHVQYDRILRQVLIWQGHDTTGTTIEWGLKFLTQRQDVQRKLWDSLQVTFAGSAEDGGTPAAVDIAKTQTPYLDAVIEEILRCGGTAAANIRVAVQDTEIFGHHIPKGTDVFMLVSTPFQIPPVLLASLCQDVQHRLRSIAQPATSGGYLASSVTGFWRINLGFLS